MNCIYCYTSCNGTCEEWEKMELIVEELSETLDEKETTIKSDKKCWIKINTNDCFHYKMDDGKTLLCIVLSDELKKKKRIYKKKNELFYSKRVSYKCLECRFDRKKCITNNYYETCNRCAKSKSKKCVYDARLYS